MSIDESLQKIKEFWKNDGSVKDKILTVAIIFLVGTASFGLGRLSTMEEVKEPIWVEMKDLSASSVNSAPDFSSQPSQTESKPESNTVPEAPIPAGGYVVASKNGTKYHFPWCSGAKRMLDSNKIYFNSIEEAKAAGLQPAGNCKGLE